MRRIAFSFMILAITLPALGVERPVHTYSIVARDAATGQMGVAVQSHWFSVGSIVTWAEAGVGAIATQSFVDPAYGPRGLELMKSGLSAEQALTALLKVDDGRDVRQVAFVDTSGTVATSGRLDEALPIFRTVFAADPNWVELTRRLVKPGIIPDTPEGHALMEQIVSATN